MLTWLRRLFRRRLDVGLDARAQVLRLREGDFVVVRVAKVLEQRDMDALTRQMSDFFKGHRVVAVGPGEDVHVLRPEMHAGVPADAQMLDWTLHALPCEPKTPTFDFTPGQVEEMRRYVGAVARALVTRFASVIETSVDVRREPNAWPDRVAAPRTECPVNPGHAVRVNEAAGRFTCMECPADWPASAESSEGIVRLDGVRMDPLG